MEQVKELANGQEVKRLSDERVYELLQILFPYGHSTNGNSYVGPVPCYGRGHNIIEVRTEDFGGDKGVFCMILHSLAADVKVCDIYGYYVGVMNIIAPELTTDNKIFDETANCLAFRFRDEKELKENVWKDMKVWP